MAVVEATALYAKATYIYVCMHMNAYDMGLSLPENEMLLISRVDHHFFQYTTIWGISIFRHTHTHAHINSMKCQHISEMVTRISLIFPVSMLHLKDQGSV